MQMSSAAAMQQVASERQREEKLLARQAKLIPVAFSGPRPRLVSLVRLAVECQWNTGFFIIFPRLNRHRPAKQLRRLRTLW